MGVCGGYSGEFIGTGPKCFGLLLPVQREEKAKWVELAQMSSGIMGAAAVTLDEKVWVLGGKVGHNGKPSGMSPIVDTFRLELELVGSKPLRAFFST